MGVSETILKRALGFQIDRLTRFFLENNEKY